jgi:hypothetical protein
VVFWLYTKVMELDAASMFRIVNENSYDVDVLYRVV